MLNLEDRDKVSIPSRYYRLTPIPVIPGIDTIDNSIELVVVVLYLQFSSDKFWIYIRMHV